MAPFAKLLPFLNKVFPPSAVRLHAPGELDEIVRLMFPVLPPGYSVGEWGAFENTLAANTEAPMGFPSAGNVRIILAAHGVINQASGCHLALVTSGGVHFTVLTNSTQFPVGGGLWPANTPFPLNRTLIHGAGWELRFQTFGAAGVVTLRAIHIDLKAGEVDPAFVA